MKVYIRSVLILLTMNAILNATMTYEIQHQYNSTRSLSNESIQNVVGTVLQPELSSLPYLKALVKVYPSANKQSSYYVIHLLRADRYLVKTFKLEFEQGEASTVTENYIENEQPEDKVACGICPNPNVEALMSWITDFPTSKSNGVACTKALKDAGLVVDTLVGKEESLSKIKDYLACPKLKIWMRIGHGNTNLISLGAGQSITNTTVASMKQFFKNKIFIFNSCLCHQEPFQGAMIDAGVYYYAGGDISLITGKEQVTTYFVNHAIKNKEELDKAMDAATQEAAYPNAWGQSGAAKKPWLFHNAGNAISPILSHSSPSIIHHLNFHLKKTKNAIYFLNSDSYHVSIYDIKGKLVYQQSAPKAWSMTSFNGTRVTAGCYRIVARNSTKTIMKSVNVL